MRRDLLATALMVTVIMGLLIAMAAALAEGWAAVLASWIFIMILVSANNRLSDALGWQRRETMRLERDLVAAIHVIEALQQRLLLDDGDEPAARPADTSLEIALARLDLDPGILPDRETLKAARRRAILRTHPDSGGSAARTLAVEDAYRNLMERQPS